MAAASQTRSDRMEEVKKVVNNNIDVAQAKQKEGYKKRVRRQYTPLAVGDHVLVRNSRKDTTKKKGNLQPNYEGPYTIVDIKGKMAELSNRKGLSLKTKISLDRLKVFNGKN